MHRIVIDSSLVLKWIPGQGEEKVEEARKVYQLLLNGKLEIHAPTFLLVEVLNVLARKRKAKYELIKRNMEVLREGKIQFIDTTVNDLSHIEKYVSRYNVTSYDALYLHVARVNKCQLLTVDRELLKIKNLTVSIDKFLSYGKN